MTCSEHTGTPKTPREIKTYQTYCPLCKGAGPDLVLGQVVRYLNEDGSTLAYGHPGGEVSKHLMKVGMKYDYEIVDDDACFAAVDVCQSCKRLLDAQSFNFEKVVAEGGVRWFCDTCKSAGVIVANDSLGFCANIRQETKIYPPDIVTVKFNNCNQHASVEDVKTLVQ